MNSVNLAYVQQRLYENDESALSELYRLYYRKLVVFSKSIVRRKELAEEVVEDVFIKMWCNRSSLSEIKNLNVYLYTAIKNASLNILSQKSKLPLSSSFDILNVEPEDEFVNPYELIITSEMMHQCEEAIDTLPPRCKLIFRMVREDGLKYKEISEILNISINTIDAQMAIAIKKICSVLQIRKPGKRITLFTTGK